MVDSGPDAFANSLFAYGLIVGRVDRFHYPNAVGFRWGVLHSKWWGFDSALIETELHWELIEHF